MFYRQRRKIRSSRVKQNILMLILISCIFVMSLGYASFSQYMKIEGMAIIDKKWDVYISDVTVANTNNGVGTYSAPSDRSLVSLNVNLPSTTSTVTYTIKLTNRGNTKGKLYSIEKIEDANTSITYTITGVTEGTTTIESGATVTATVVVKYATGITSLTDAEKRIVLGFNFEAA